MRTHPLALLVAAEFSLHLHPISCIPHPASCLLPPASCLLPPASCILHLFPVVLQLLLLCGFAFLAGFIDSVVGGGGLIQLPALLLILPSSLPFATVSGTNKSVGFTGTLSAAGNYARHVRIEWRVALPGAAMGFVFSALGSRTVSHLDPALLRPMVLGMLVAVAIYTFARKDFGSLHAPKLNHRQQFWIGALAGAVLGFYDGFFGPGTGSFLIFIFIGVCGFDFLSASAAAKVINSATNLASVIYFAATGHILYHLAVPMAACNVLGSFAGTRLAILRGSRFVRILFLIVVSAIICKLAYDMAHPR